jgi:DNA-binding PadR family transcriptional regulator
VARRAPLELSPAAWASLALLAEQPTHGFAIARALAPEGEVGRVWSCSRPLVYRALAVLGELALIEERGWKTSGRGPRRRVFGPTRAGRREVRRWLAEPSAHVRDLRSGLMLKLLFLSRRGADASELLARQQAALQPVVDGLAEAVSRADGFDRILYLWRLESARAALRFVEEVLNSAEPAASPSP